MLRQSHGGIILNIGATTAIRGRTNGVNYCSSKAGVLAITKCVALEMAPKVRVNCVIPGSTHVRAVEDPERLRTREATIPLGRLGTPEDISNVVSFLVSDQAAYIHGQKIIVDGGQFMY
jgi:acetoacetyl-CoA reductase/3-oxoacyl-[acyl-carrier protein] reductase